MNQEFLLHIKETYPSLLEELADIYQHLHRHPERSMQEYETTAYVKAYLIDLGYEIMELVIETGVVAILRGKSDSPCVALRADMDALPIQEASGVPYTSLAPGVMHACGHDIHMTCLLGAAKLLAPLKGKLNGTIKLIFQPGEEGYLGARYMMKAGAFEHPKVDAVFGLHNSPEVPLGSVGLKNGALMAAVHRFYITLRGKGGHGAIPHKNVDPIPAGAAIIQSLQSLVSRETDPLKSCVVSICSLHAGDELTFNVTPETLTMAGTCRCYDKEIEAGLEKRIRSIVEHTASAYQLTGELEYHVDHRAVINDSNLYQNVCDALDCMDIPYMDPIPSTAGEDFSEYIDKAPIFLFWLGVRNEKTGCTYPWHSPFFKADMECLPIGAAVYAASALFEMS